MSPQRIRVSEADLKFTAFSEVYDRLSRPKTRRQAFALLEAAISCVAKHGFRGITLAKLAREAGVARSLLTHYFRDLDEILDFAIKYIRLLFQKLAVRALSEGSSPRDMFERYLDACFTWVIRFRTHALVWLTFLHLCAVAPAKRALNTVAVRAGFDRLVALLERGRCAGDFRFDDPAHTAALIQNVITGGLLCLVSEDHLDVTLHQRRIRGACLSLLGASS